MTRFYGTTPHGDVTYLANASAVIKATRTYSPYGEVRSATGEDSALGYQSDLTDPDSDLVDMGARLYHPGLGRFTSVDPADGRPTTPLSMNAHLYGHADPLTNTDPTGLAVADIGGGSAEVDPDDLPDPPPGSPASSHREEPGHGWEATSLVSAPMSTQTNARRVRVNERVATASQGRSGRDFYLGEGKSVTAGLVSYRIQYSVTGVEQRHSRYSVTFDLIAVDNSHACVGGEVCFDYTRNVKVDAKTAGGTKHPLFPQSHRFLELLTSTGELAPDPVRFSGDYHASYGRPEEIVLSVSSITNNAEGAGIAVTNFDPHFNEYHVPLDVLSATDNPSIVFRHR